MCIGFWSQNLRDRDGTVTKNNSGPNLHENQQKHSVCDLKNGLKTKNF